VLSATYSILKKKKTIEMFVFYSYFLNDIVWFHCCVFARQFQHHF